MEPSTPVGRSPSARPSGAWRGALALAVDAFEGYARHRSDLVAAGLSFRAILSVAPLLLVAQALLGWWLGGARAREAVLAPVQSALGDRSAAALAGWLDAALRYSATATVVGVALFVIGATRFVIALDDALDVVFELPPRRQLAWQTRVRDWVLTQLKAFGVTLGLVVGLGLALGLAAVATSSLHQVGAARWLVEGVQWALGALTLGGALALVYRTLPGVPMSAHDVVIAAAFGTVLLLGATVLLRFYFAVVDVGAAYGATAAVFVALLWLFYSAEAFVLGAELAASSRAHRRLATPRTVTARASGDVGITSAAHAA